MARAQKIGDHVSSSHLETYPDGFTLGRFMEAILYIVAGVMLMASVAAHFYVRVRLKPGDDELDDYYYELEESHPGYARYGKWLRITFGGIALGVLLLFVAMAV